MFPRCVFSPADAMYCARFSERLQSMDTPFFRSIFYYDRVLKDITQLVVCCTEYEAGRLGRAVQVDPVNTMLKAPEIKRLKAKI